MIKYDKRVFSKSKETKTQVRVTTEVKQPNGKYSKITVKNFGYLEDQENKEQFLEMVKKFDEEYKKGKKVFLELDNGSCLDEKYTSYNFGHYFLGAVYDYLEIDNFFENIKTKTTYDLSSVFRFNIMMRILEPSSIRSSIQLKDALYNSDTCFRLHQDYRALSKFALIKDDLLVHLNKIVKDKIGRKDQYALFDCTNYYFEKDFPKGLAQRGVSKEHRTEPIVQLGLFIDSNALPIAFDVFNGNTSDSKIIRPIMKEVNKRFNLNKLIIVGDKGFNTKENITQIINDGNGFVFSQKLRGKGKTRPKYQDKCFETEGWIGDENYKYKLFEDELDLKNLDETSRKTKVKVLIYYKKEIAALEKARRDEKINKAKEYIKSNPGIAKLTSDKNKKKYVKSVATVKESGEVADKYILFLDEEAIKEEEKLDGYMCLITSELDYDENKIKSSYGQLWMIEESFRITKSDFENRPIYVSTDEHIRGRMLETFVALLIIRIIQYLMKDKRISAQRIIECLNSCNCTEITRDVVHIQRIGGRNAFYYKKYKNNVKEQSTLKLVNEIIEDNSEQDTSIPKSCYDQITTDFKLLLKTYNIEEPNAWMRKIDFEKYLKNINLSTILGENKRKRGRPKNKN